jgi:hypothetical protein
VSDNWGCTVHKDNEKALDGLQKMRNSIINNAGNLSLYIYVSHNQTTRVKL